MSGDGEQERWKHKYLETLGTLEEKERAWRLNDESLRHGLSRLALVSTGLNPGLDVQLKKLRRALQDQADSDYLNQIFARISDYLKTLDEQGAGHASAEPENSVIDVLQRMMERIDFPKPHQARAKQLQRALKEKEAAAHLDEWVGAFAALLRNAFYPGEAAAPAPAAEKTGWWQRLFSGSAEPKAPAEITPPPVATPPREPVMQTSAPPAAAAPANAPRLEPALLDFLEHLSLPRQFSERVQALRDRLTAGLGASEIQAMTKALVELITDSQRQLEQEKEELELFLKQLGQRLQELDAMVDGAENSHRASFESGLALDAMVRAQVDDIEQTVQSVGEVKQMQGLIQGSLDNIRQHLAQKTQLDEQRQSDLEQQLKAMNLRLSQMESESEQLRSRLAEERQQAMTDPLTHVPNRLGYEKQVTLEFARWQRYGSPLSMLVCDIDHFKKINDSYGHKAGDRALMAIAKAIAGHIRSSDYLARIGGEEFVVLLPETSLDNAKAVAEKLRKGVELCMFVYEGKQVPITISGGIAEFAGGDKIDDVYARADKALYRAKHAGRNRFLPQE